MIMFTNFYTCYRCGKTWCSEWVCMCDDDCPHCGARHCSPEDSQESEGDPEEIEDDEEEEVV